MMGSGRTNAKGKAPAYFANSISPNVDEDSFDSILHMPFSSVGWDDIHQSVAHGVPETIRNPRVCSVDPKSFQNPQINQHLNSANTNLQEVPLLSDWNMGCGQQYMNQGNNALSSGGVSTFGGESGFGSVNSPQVNRDVNASSFLFGSRDTAPVHTRNNVNYSTNQSRIQGTFEGSFLSLGLNSGEISDKYKEAASNELKMARDQQATSQTFDDGFMGSLINNSGFSNQHRRVSRMTSTNNEFGSHGSLNGGLSSNPHHILQMQQNGRQIGHSDKLMEAPSTELKMVHAQKAAGQSLDADFMGFQRNNSGFSDQFSYVDRMTSTNNEVEVYTTLNSGLGSGRQSISQMQENYIRNVRSSDLDHYKGNVHPATLGGNSASFFNSQQHNLKPSESVKPSWMTYNYTPYEQLQYFRSTTDNSPNYASKQGQVISQSATPNQVHGGNLYSQRTKTPHVSWVGSGPAGIDAPFPKRLGVESSVRNSPQSSQRHLSGPICQLSDKGFTRMPQNVLRPIGQSDGAPVSYPLSFQEPFFTYGQSENALIQRAKGPQVAPSTIGQSENALIQRAKGPQGAPSTIASSIDGQLQKLDFHVRPHHKRTAVTPQSTSHWVQRQRIIHPPVHHSMTKPPVPVTTPLFHPSMPVRSRTQHLGPVAAHIPPVIPGVSNVKPRVPIASAPVVSHITWKGPDATSKLSGHKCLLCKRDLALTSEGTVFQPAVPPPVAVLPCGHTFHDQCLQNITPDDQAKDPPCIPCAIGEN